MKNFGITGVAGYIAPRHLKAIKDTGNNLIAALDPHDSVGILDSYFPDTKYFREFERFDRHLEKIKRTNNNHGIDYLTICSPNHLHDAHIRLALRLGANAICEKPIVLNPWNLDLLQELEQESGKKVYTVLQLRVHPSLVKLKEKILTEKIKTKKDITLTYITSRGSWYHHSWKGNLTNSGGIATNIGVHFFDLLSWLFGDLQNQQVHFSNSNKIGGFLELQNANVKWFLSIDKNDLPENVKQKNQPTYRSIKIDGEEIEFTGGFTDLHTTVYQEIIDGKGFGINDARNSIETVYKIRNSEITNNLDNAHPILLKILK
ncbi:MAG: Gfo/Idh/MocA family oxidoreductase [Ignavibacteriales bacterium]|nr:Gfo/Idh/MocA family oxidoreductase [Ignavibacteriales bacterium]